LGPVKNYISQLSQTKDPQQRVGLASKMSQMFLPPQGVNTQAGTTPMDLGGQIQPGVTAPAAAGGGFTPTGAPIDKTLPPTQTRFNPQTNQMETVGHPAGGTGPVATSAPIGVPENIAANVSDMNTHFSGLQNASQGAALISGLTGNIKALAHKAIVGTEDDKLSYANGLLVSLGAGDKQSQDLKTATDELHKQLAMINTSTPASTDAKQQLIQAAQPGSKMSPDAMDNAADQVASQVQLNMAMRNKLSPIKYAPTGQDNSPAYQQLRQKLETIDPRVLQWNNLGPGSPEASQYLSNLNPSDKAALRKSLKTARETGIL